MDFMVRIDTFATVAAAVGASAVVAIDAPNPAGTARVLAVSAEARTIPVAGHPAVFEHDAQPLQRPAHPFAGGVLAYAEFGPHFAQGAIGEEA
jgi:hypothetical protein